MAVACVLDWIDAPDAEGRVVAIDDGSAGGEPVASASLWTDAR